MLAILLRSKLTYIVVGFYLIILGWWIYIDLFNFKETYINYWFGFVYAIIALIGTFIGLIASGKWGGYKSYVGKGIIFLSLGLLGEWFGQTIWSYYNIIARLEVPYPSIADIGYFSIIPFYGLGMIYFARASGIKFSLSKIDGKIKAILIPVIMVSISYFLFLRNLNMDFTHPIRTFLDFGYPLGEAITISIALLTYIVSVKTLGGKMRARILFIIFALFFQYITDYIFLYKAADGTYFNGGFTDLMYATSFTIMAIGLISFKEL